MASKSEVHRLQHGTQEQRPSSPADEGLPHTMPMLSTAVPSDEAEARRPIMRWSAGYVAPGPAVPPVP